MICDLCGKKPAAIFMESVLKGGIKKINLCNECAVKRGIIPPAITPNQIDIQGIFRDIELRKAELDIDTKRLCPACGKSLYEIKRTGCAGCPECYSVFSGDIKNAFSSHGLNGKYSGSLPKRVKGFKSSLTDRSDLQAKLEEAIKIENYEKAAVYRDYLKALENGEVFDGEVNE